MTLPPATPKPCNECPWRRASTPGWLGPYDAAEWLEVAHGESPIACHTTIVRTDEDGIGDWSDPVMRQCAGAAIFRANVAKSPRSPEIERRPADRDTVFAWNDEFIEHHKGSS